MAYKSTSMAVGLTLAFGGTQLLAPTQWSIAKELKSPPAGASQDVQRRILTEDQARRLVKEIPLVNVQQTLSRWVLPETELATLRQWSASLVKQPDRTDFLAQWSKLISKTRDRDASLSGTDLTHLIQMLMAASYEEASKDLDSFRERARFYQAMQGRISENLTAARGLQVLIRPQLNDPSAGALIRLPAYNRGLQTCQEQSGVPIHLECHEVLIATTMELDQYMASSDKQLAEAKEKAQQAELDLQTGEQRRIQTLETLSETAKAMYEAAMNPSRTTTR
jgi:hypothetical protein